MKSDLTLDDVKDILRKEIKRSQTHSNYFSYLGVDRSDDVSITEGLERLEKEEEELRNKKKSEFDSEVETILR